MSEDKALESWFLHEKLVLSLLSERDAVDLTWRIPNPERPFAEVMRVELFERVLTRYLEHNEVGSLEVEHVRGQLKVGQLVWLEQAIAFRGVGVAVERVSRGSDGRAFFSARLATNKEVRVKGSYNAARLTCSSAAGQLIGTQRQFILGYVDTITDDEIGLRPIVIARRWLRRHLQLVTGTRSIPRTCGRVLSTNLRV